VPFGIPEIDALAESHPGKLFSFGMDGGDFRASKITFGDGTHFLMDCPWGSRKITVHVPGRHNIANALAAAAACLNLGSGLDEIAHGLEILEAPSWRMETVKFGQNHVLIKDYYNANPQSMRAALETLADFDSSSGTLAILGDMMELGELSETLHRDLGKFAALLKINKVIFIGQKGRFFGEGYKSVCGSTASLELFDDKDSAWEAIKSEIGAHDRILVNASRSMKMELIANRILEEI
jgi:UDP-N-acetylmuramoyl-tripeptide--D-alanyl-D-alanine ligase